MTFFAVFIKLNIQILSLQTDYYNFVIKKLPMWKSMFHVEHKNKLNITLFKKGRSDDTTKTNRIY